MRPFRCVPGSFLFVTALMLIGAMRADAQSGQAADTIRGLAYDSLSWQPLAGALVTAEPGGESAVSDSAGRFLIVSSRRVDRLVAFHERTDRLGLGELVATRPEVVKPRKSR